MAKSSIAFRYAKSLVQLATEDNKMEEVYGDMRKLLGLCKLNDFRLLLESPLIKTDKKISTFKSVLKGEISEITDKFLVLLAKNKRESYLEKIAEEFVDQYKTIHNVSTVVITSATKLDEPTRKKMVSILTNHLKATIELVEKTDPKIIGGFVLTVGNRQADMSVLKQLKQLNKNFNQTHILN
ncbi:MAG TPA: ATP synthase F1 subunit delta [Bacteroidia bacterium]|jgi:F-type H+-transporting ATPase subunit delta|nr:ATP synthase F1 subunit delta [Bacteroidia bacterium]